MRNLPPHVFAHAFLLSSTFLYGYIEEIHSLAHSDRRTIRISIIIAIFFYSAIIYILYVKKNSQQNLIAPIGLLLVLYAFLVSTAHGAILDGLSPLLRLLSFILLFSWAYGLPSSGASKEKKFMRLLLLQWC